MSGKFVIELTEEFKKKQIYYNVESFVIVVDHVSLILGVAHWNYITQYTQRAENPE